MVIFNEYPLIRDNMYMVHTNVDMNFVNIEMHELLVNSMFNSNHDDYIIYLTKMGEKISFMQKAYGLMHEQYSPIIYVGTFADKGDNYLSLNSGVIQHIVITIGRNNAEARLRKIYADELKFLTPRLSTEGRLLDAIESNIMNKIYSNDRLLRQSVLPTISNLSIVPEYEKLQFAYHGDMNRKVLFELNYKTKEIKIISQETFGSLSKKEINYINTALLSAYNVIPCMFVETIGGYELTLI